MNRVLVTNGCFLVFTHAGRDSPPPNDVSEENDEAMPIPEDLSASSNLQHNNRGDKEGMGE